MMNIAAGAPSGATSIGPGREVTVVESRATRTRMGGGCARLARLASVIAVVAGCGSSNDDALEGRGGAAGLGGQSGGSSGAGQSGASARGGVSGTGGTIDCEGTNRKLVTDELRVGALTADEEALFFTVLTDSDRPIGSVRVMDRRSETINTLSQVEHPIGLALTAENIVWSVERPGYLGVLPRSGGVLQRVNYGRAPYALSALGDAAYFAYQDAMPALYRLDDGMEEPTLIVDGDVQPIYVLPSESGLLFFDASSRELKAHSATEGITTIATFSEIPSAMTADDEAVVWWEGGELVWLNRESGERLTLAGEEDVPRAVQLHDGSVFWISGSQVRQSSPEDETPSVLVSCSVAVGAMAFVADTAFVAAGSEIFEVELP